MVIIAFDGDGYEHNYITTGFISWTDTARASYCNEVASHLSKALKLATRMVIKITDYEYDPKKRTKFVDV